MIERVTSGRRAMSLPFKSVNVRIWLEERKSFFPA